MREELVLERRRNAAATTALTQPFAGRDKNNGVRELQCEFGSRGVAPFVNGRRRAGHGLTRRVHPIQNRSPKPRFRTSQRSCAYPRFVLAKNKCGDVPN